ncbi:hypothetical protein [Bradyrhizobium sp. AZCC 2289]|uniref:hypothetical protein n=1 Tax=Bradyrhizobium sp. AZCC 2289 TaxID=3117026 RepID=UPI002FF14A5F
MADGQPSHHHNQIIWLEEAEHDPAPLDADNLVKRFIAHFLDVLRELGQKKKLRPPQLAAFLALAKKAGK